MEPKQKTCSQPRAGEGLQGIQKFWPLDEGAWGYGVIADIGTAEVTCRLYAIETDEMLGEISRPNPQLPFGKSIAERLDAAREGNLEKMRFLIEEELVSMFSELAEADGISLSQIETIVICGNTVMECIAGGIDPHVLAESFEESKGLFGCGVDYLAAGSQGITAGEAYFAPCPSFEVGGDVVCGLLAVDILSAEAPKLYVDFGTYTEIALGDKNGIVACAIGEDRTLGGAIGVLLRDRGISAGQVETVYISNGGVQDIPSYLRGRVRCIGNAAIEGASAVLLSDEAEDELCSIAESCKSIKI